MKDRKRDLCTDTHKQADKLTFVERWKSIQTDRLTKGPMNRHTQTGRQKDNWRGGKVYRLTDGQRKLCADTHTNRQARRQTHTQKDERAYRLTDGQWDQFTDTR